LFPARVVFFSLLPTAEGVYFFLRLSASSAALYLLEEAPSLLFLLLAAQQVLGWARSYHVMRGEEAFYRAVVRRVALGGVGTVAALQVALCAAFYATRGSVDPDLLSLCASLLHAAAFAGTAAALCAYGVGLRRALRSTPLPLAARERQQSTFALVNALCAVAFLLRVLLLAGASWADYVDFDDVRGRFKPEDAAVSVLFFSLTEILPMAVVMWANRGGSGGGGAQRMPSLALLIESPGGSGRALTPSRRSLSPAAARALSFSQSPRREETSPRATASTASVLLGLGGMVLAALAPGGGARARSGDGERVALLGAGAAAGGAGSSGAAGYGSGAGAGKDVRGTMAANAAAAAAAAVPPAVAGAEADALAGARATALSER
jgi:hypothetical protein